MTVFMCLEEFAAGAVEVEPEDSKTPPFESDYGPVWQVSGSGSKTGSGWSPVERSILEQLQAGSCTWSPFRLPLGRWSHKT